MLYLDNQHALSGFEGHTGSHRWHLLRTCGGRRLVVPGGQSRSGGSGLSSTGGDAGRQPPVSTGAKAHVAWEYVLGCAPEAGRALSTPAQAFPRQGGDSPGWRHSRFRPCCWAQRLACFPFLVRAVLPARL